MTVFNKLVEVAHSAHAHDALPSVVLLEDLKHLVLMGHLGQNGRILLVGNTEQHSVEILLHAKKIQLLRVGQERSIVIVHIVVDLIIGGVELSVTGEEFDFGLISLLAKHLHGLLGGHLVARDGYVGIDDFLHSAAYGINVLQSHGMSQLQVHIVAVGHRNVDDHFRMGIKVVDGLAQDKE